MSKIPAAVCLLLMNYYAFSQEYIPPQPYGGKAQLRQFTEQELVYPETALQAKTEGNVIISAKIDQKGQVTFTRYKARVSPECDLETMRIFKMIEWEPGTFRGIPNEDSIQFEIEFNLRKYKRLCKQRGYSEILFPFEPVDTSGTIYQYKNLETAPHPIFTRENINLAGFVAANLVYPEAAIKQNLSGTVKIGFIVEPHGRISNTIVLNSLGAGCNEEALRLVHLIKWMPGTIHQQAVRTRMSISINFSLDQGPDGNFNPNIKSSYGG
ncbi:MAG: TonB family protein [Lentimicrobiaceae bacterium]|nr:TonB family protein [Lentimicrobiaceae bacterium]